MITDKLVFQNGTCVVGNKRDNDTGYQNKFQKLLESGTGPPKTFSENTCITSEVSTTTSNFP